MTAVHWTSLAVIVVCLLLSAFFSGSGTALTTASRVRMNRLEKQGNPRARVVNRLLDARERLIGTLLVGNGAAIVVASTLAAGLLLAWFGGAGVIYAAVVMAVLVVVFAEALPRTAAIGAPDRIALWTARPMAWLMRLFGPVVSAIETVVRVVLRLLGVKGGDDLSIVSPDEETRGTVDLPHPDGGLEKVDRDMFGGLLDLRDLTVSDVMIHRTEMITVNAGEPSADVVRDVLAAPVTRIPLWLDRPENIVGILHAKDLLRAIQAADGDLDAIDVKAIARPPWFVPDIRPLDEQLKAFRRRRTPLALVVDEYGEVMGLVTLEDILEEIVGDIADEHDIEVPGVRRQPDGSVAVDGGVPIRDLNRVMDWSLPDEEATTVAGLVIHEAQSIPEQGQTFTFHGFRFRVLRRERNRITALRIQPLARAPVPAGRAG